MALFFKFKFLIFLFYAVINLNIFTTNKKLNKKLSSSVVILFDEIKGLSGNYEVNVHSVTNVLMRQASCEVYS